MTNHYKHIIQVRNSHEVNLTNLTQKVFTCILSSVDILASFAKDSKLISFRVTDS